MKNFISAPDIFIKKGYTEARLAKSKIISIKDKNIKNKKFIFLLGSKNLNIWISLNI